MRVHNILFILAQLSVGSSHFGFDDAISNEKENVPLDSEKNDALFYSNRFAEPHGGENFEDIDSTKDVENKNIEQPLPHDEPIKLNKDNADAANNEIVTKDIETVNFSNISTKYYGMARHLLKYGGIRIFDKNNEGTILDLKLVNANLNMTKTLKNGTKLISEMKNVDKNNIVIIINNILTSENVNKDDNIYSTHDDLNMSSTLKIIGNENKDMASSIVHTNEDVKKLKDHNKTMTLGGQHFGTEDKFSTRPDAKLDPSKVMGSGRRMDYDMDYTDRPPVMDIDAIIEATGNPHEFQLKPPRGPIQSFIPGNEALPADVGPGLGGRKAANQVKSPFGTSTAQPDGAMDRFGAGDLGDYGMVMNDELEPSGGTTVSYEPFDDATINLATMRPEDMYDYAQMAAEDHSRTSTIAIKEDAARAPTPGTTVRETEQVPQDHTDKNLEMDYNEGKMKQPNNLVSQIRMQYPFLDKASGVEYTPEPESLQNNMQEEIENKMYGIKPINPPPDILGLLNSDSKQPYQPNNKLQTSAPIYPVNNQNAMPNLPGVTSNFPSAIPNYQNGMSYFPGVMPNFQSSMPNFPGVMPNFPSAVTKYPNALPNFSGYMSYLPSSGPNFPGVSPNFQNAMTNFPNSLPYFSDTVSNTPITQHAIVRRTNDLGSYLYSEYDLTLTPLIDAITSATSDNTSTTSKMEQSISPKADKFKYVADTVSPVRNDVTIGLSSTPMAVVSPSQPEISFQSPVIFQNFAPHMPFRSNNVYVHAPTMVNETVRRLVTDFNTSPSEATTAVTVTSTPDQQVTVNTSALTLTTKEYHWYDNDSFRRNTAIPVTSTQEEVTINTSTTRKEIVNIRVRSVVEETQYTRKTPLTTSPTTVVQIQNVVTESEPQISTLADLINNFVSKMMKLDGGYLTTFASLSAEYLAMKNFTVLQELSHAFVKEWDQMAKTHKAATLKFGRRWLMEIIHLKRTLLAADVFKLMQYVLNVHLALSNRNVSLTTDLNMLLSFIDTLYTPSEGEKMARVAEHIRQYPNKLAEGYTASYIMRDMLYEIVLFPFIRLDTSLNKKLLIDGVTVYLNKYRGDGSFNKTKMETKSRRADSPQNFIDLEKNEATATDDAEKDPTRTGESGQRYQHRLARDRYRIPVKTSLATFGTDLMHGQRQSFTLTTGKDKSKPIKVKHNCKHNCKQNCRMAATRGETSTTQQPTDQKHTSTNTDSKQNLPKGYKLHMRRPTPYTRYDRSKIYKYDTMINDYMKKRKVDGESSLGMPFSSSKRHSKERSHNYETENHGNNGVTKFKKPGNARDTENHVNKDGIERPDDANKTEVTINDNSYSVSVEREPETVDFLPEEDKREREHKRQYLKHKSVKGDDNLIVDHVNDNQKLNYTVRGFYTERSPTRRNKTGRRNYDNNYDNAANYNEFSTLYNGGNYNKNYNFKYNKNDDIRERQNRYKEIKHIKPQTISNSLLEKKKKDTDKSLHYIEHEFINKIKQKFHSLRHKKEDSYPVISNSRNAQTNWISPAPSTKYIQTSSSATQFFNPRNKFHNNGVTKTVGITRKPVQEINNINQDEIDYFPNKRASSHPKIMYPAIHEPTYQSHYMQTKKQHIQMAYVPHKSKGNTHYIKPQYRVNSSHRFVRRKKIKPEFDIPDENGRRMDVSAEVIDDIDHVGELINKQNILHSESDEKILWDKIDEIETRLNKHMPSRRKYIPREPRQRKPQAAVHNPIPFRSDLTASTFQHKDNNSKANVLSQQQKEEPDKRAIVIM